jgi:prepilin-type N-terminal cleavage/methylation domain-containing protein
MMGKSRNAEAGYTVVELLMAIIVASILTTAINSIHNSHARLSQRNRDLTLANSFAENKKESLRSQGFLGLTDGYTDITAELPAELNTPRSGQVQVTAQNAAVKKVYVTITYNDQGSPRTYNYSTFVGELGVGQY